MPKPSITIRMSLSFDSVRLSVVVKERTINHGAPPNSPLVMIHTNRDFTFTLLSILHVFAYSGLFGGSLSKWALIIGPSSSGTSWKGRSYHSGLDSCKISSRRKGLM